MAELYGFTVSGAGSSNLYAIDGILEEHDTMTRFFPDKSQMLEGAYIYYSLVANEPMAKASFFSCFPRSVCINTNDGPCIIDFYHSQLN